MAVDSQSSPRPFPSGSIPDLEDPSIVSLNEENPSEAWIEWYQETFATELSLVNYNNAKKKAAASTNVAETSYLQSEVERLKRRLKAVDALEDLCGDVESTSPIPSRLWEEDASRCHGCEQELGLLFHLKRRHHCRYCGLTFCDECAPGEIRRCKACYVKKTRFEAIKAVRQSERQALSANTAISKDGVLNVARAYRLATDAFTQKSGDAEMFIQRAKGILLEGLQSFMDLEEAKACFASRASA
jgi:FYVE zinc finger